MNTEKYIQIHREREKSLLEKSLCKEREIGIPLKELGTGPKIYRGLQMNL